MAVSICLVVKQKQITKWLEYEGDLAVASFIPLVTQSWSALPDQPVPSSSQLFMGPLPGCLLSEWGRFSLKEKDHAQL